ncbi:YihY/virulence factor BrkB family protein [Amnibacterium flavum]|uniref:YihY/virulence factor BrkB family protein n=2 Tax=Amnibacterium flavum TaxID=2173173 RepID=A0A2V1HM95_9MICO|nr:YihY/virulence factor BrkB family protein [Amnibacterium flavum]
MVRVRIIDSTAALTFFAALTLFPASLTAISAFAIGGGDSGAVRFIRDLIEEVFGPEAAETARGPLEQLTSISNPGVALGFGIVLLLWTGSAYATAFGRAANAIYGVQEGRRIWKFRSLMAIVAAVLIVGVAGAVILLIGTPKVAEAAADVLGVGQPWITVWLIGRWPVVFALACVLIAVLYYWTPTIERQSVALFSWGSVVALVGWAAATGGFIFYVANLAHYDEVYGWLGGALVVLLWLYITNFMLLAGATLDAEFVRVQQLRDGIPAESVIQVPMRDTSRNLTIARSLAADEADGRTIREDADRERHAAAKHIDA